MVDTSYQKKILKINQIWFPADKTIKELLGGKRKADILFVHGVPETEIKGKFRGWQEFHTCINTLTPSEEEILVGVNKNVKYEIRRSQRDGIDIKFYGKEDIEANRELLTMFADLYRRMYKSKGIEASLNLSAVGRYLEDDKMLFSAVWREGEMLVFHSYVCDSDETRLLHSASCFREGGAVDQNMIGRANKKLHWEDMLYFKQKGFARYDWGGISDFDSPNGIDAFKLKFGGEKVTYYNVYAGNTLLGKAAVAAMKLLKRIN